MRDFESLTKEELELYKAKNEDYTGGKGDTFGNFNRVSKALNELGLNVTPAQVCFTYMLKQIDGAGRMLFNNYEGKVETIDTRLRDVHIYAKICRLLGSGK